MIEDELDPQYHEHVSQEVTHVLNFSRPLGSLASILHQRCQLFPLSNSTERYFTTAKQLDTDKMEPTTLAALFLNNPICRVPYQKHEPWWDYPFCPLYKGFLSIHPVKFKTFRGFMGKHEAILKSMDLNLHTTIDPKILALKEAKPSELEEKFSSKLADRRMLVKVRVKMDGSIATTNGKPNSQVSSEKKAKIITKYLDDMPKLYETLYYWLQQRIVSPLFSKDSDAFSTLIKYVFVLDASHPTVCTSAMTITSITCYPSIYHFTKRYLMIWAARGMEMI